MQASGSRSRLPDAAVRCRPSGNRLAVVTAVGRTGRRQGSGHRSAASDCPPVGRRNLVLGGRNTRRLFRMIRLRLLHSYRRCGICWWSMGWITIIDESGRTPRVPLHIIVTQGTLSSEMMGRHARLQISGEIPQERDRAAFIWDGSLTQNQEGGEITSRRRSPTSPHQCATSSVFLGRVADQCPMALPGQRKSPRIFDGSPRTEGLI